MKVELVDKVIYYFQIVPAKSEQGITIDIDNAYLIEYIKIQDKFFQHQFKLWEKYKENLSCYNK